MKEYQLHQIIKNTSLMEMGTLHRGYRPSEKIIRCNGQHTDGISCCSQFEMYFPFQRCPDCQQAYLLKSGHVYRCPSQLALRIMQMLFLPEVK